MKVKGLLYMIIGMFIVSCDISENEDTPTEEFFRVFDDNSFDASYIPIDIAQTGDGGYIILASNRLESTNFTGVSLLKVDENGTFVSQENLNEEIVNPVDQLITIDGNHYFLGMNATSLQSILFTVNDSAQVAAQVPLAGLTYPMYLNSDGNGLLALSYNNFSKSTVLSKVSTAGVVDGEQAVYTIGAGSDTEAPIISHFTRTGKQLPFFAGRLSNSIYYFNGFYNYTLSLVFTSFGDEPLGVVQGQQDDGGISAAIPVNGNSFALSRFNFGDNYLSPNADVTTNGITTSAIFEDNAFPELVPDAAVIVDLIDFNGTNSILYGSSTKSGQIILMAYDANTRLLTGTHYLGSTFPYSIAGYTPTADGGLAVLGSTSVAGRFERICLFKMSPEDVSALIN